MAHIAMTAIRQRTPNTLYESHNRPTTIPKKLAAMIAQYGSTAQAEKRDPTMFSV